LFRESWLQLHSLANWQIVNHSSDVYEHMSGDVLLVADEIMTGRVESVAFYVRELSESVTYFTKAYGWLDSKLVRLATTSFGETVYQSYCVASSFSNHLDFRQFVSKQQSTG
jgi:hypothetical protein